MTKYRTIVADPPWQMPTGGRYRNAGEEPWREHRPSNLSYETMQLEEIKSLPVSEWVRKDAHLYLWVPNYHLEASYGVARAWGFKPSQVLVWAKTPRGLGLGGAFTNTTEYVLFCRRGSLKTLDRVDSTWWNWKRPEDRTGPMSSRKPEAFLDLVEQVSPGPYLEIFARRARFGWDYWGDQSLGTAEVAA